MLHQTASHVIRTTLLALLATRPTVKPVRQDSHLMQPTHHASVVSLSIQSVPVAHSQAAQVVKLDTSSIPRRIRASHAQITIFHALHATRPVAHHAQQDLLWTVQT
jgi:hypothetical protein